VKALFTIAIVVNVGMWLERFIIVVTSLHRDYLPSSWGMYAPTRWDWAIYVGTIGLFLALLFLFIRFLPMISIFEMRELVEETSAKPVGD
jgi:molybdopterin-containing oxidoreductase family membrane subunit